MLKGTYLIAALFTVLQADHIVIPPPGAPHSDTPEKMLLFIPGGDVPNSHYRETASAIQQEIAKTNNIALWAVIPSVTKNLCIIECSATAICSPLKNTIEKALGMAVTAGWKRTDDKEQIYLAGHSLGGVCANTLMQAYQYPYAALLLFGSYVDKTGATNVFNYKTPVLTMNGELDGGMARPGKTSIWWRQFLALEEKNSASALLNKPVIIVPHLNHSNFCPGFPVPGDLMADVTEAEALVTIGQYVSAFLANQIRATANPTDVATMKGGIEWTRDFLAPYLAAEAYTVNRSETAFGEGSSKLCAMAQHAIADLDKQSDAKLLVRDGFHVSSPNLEHCHPNYTFFDNYLMVDSCSHTDYYPDFANTGSIEASSEVACKLLSKGRVAQLLNAKVPDTVEQCGDVNKLVVAMAEQMAPPSTKARYDSRGKGWCYLQDFNTAGSIGPVWVFKDAIKLKQNATCMTVASPKLHTTIDGKIYPGNTYCKFLTLERVLDWMMTDSLK